MFDFPKLEWLNGEHLRLLTADRFAAELLELSASARARRWPTSRERVAEVAPIVQEKLRELSQFEGFAGFLFGPSVYADEAVGQGGRRSGRAAGAGVGAGRAGVAGRVGRGLDRGGAAGGVRRDRR